ncbi:MAG: hypothetical protein JWP63_1572 [Candidatus Solibacter sp.]|nr:hypothetical protein [Candidatus Solibacter sp.]
MRRYSRPRHLIAGCRIPLEPCAALELIQRQYAAVGAAGVASLTAAIHHLRQSPARKATVVYGNTPVPLPSGLAGFLWSKNPRSVAGVSVIVIVRSTNSHYGGEA